jgi:hypothetical protein
MTTPFICPALWWQIPNGMLDQLSERIAAIRTLTREGGCGGGEFFSPPHTMNRERGVAFEDLVRAG